QSCVLHDFGGLETFFVDDPTNEETGAVFGDLAGGEQFDVFSERYRLTFWEPAVRAVRFPNPRQAEQKIGRRHWIGTDEYPRGDSALTLDEVLRVAGGHDESRPVDGRCSGGGRGRGRVGAEQPFGGHGRTQFVAI